MIKLVAFDWNGTLLSDTQTAIKACNILAPEYGVQKISLKQFQDTFTIPVSDFWHIWAKKKIDLLEQSEKYHQVYEQQALKSRTRSGAKNLLKWLLTKNITRMIFSNHITPDISRQLIRLNIFEYFDEILARDAGDHSHVHKKSKDQKLFDYVQKNKYRPQEVITVGDTEEEIEIGKKYGYKTVAITGGYNSESRLKKHKPDFLIHNLSELKPIIQKLQHAK